MKKLIILLIASISTNVFAAPGWTGYGPISELNQQPGSIVSSSPDVLIKATLPNNGSECSVTDSFMLFVENAADERAFSMILAAFSAGKEVRLFYTGECHAWGMAVVKGAYVKY